MRLFAWTLFSIVVGCLLLGALQCLLGALRRDIRPWYRRHGEGRDL